MRIAVFIKTNPDLQMVRVKNREAVLEAVPFKVGDLEKNALEAALQLREAGAAAGATMVAEATIVAVAAGQGDRKLRETLKEALAMGADEAIVVNDPGLEAADQGGVARVLAAAVQKAGPFDLLLFGEGSSDGYSGQVPGRVAELLGLPEIGYARKLEMAGAGADMGPALGVRVERSMGDIVEVLEAPLPVAITVVSEINEPRIPSLMNIMKAGKKPLSEFSLADLGLGAAAVVPQRTVLSNLAEEQDRKHVLFEGDVAQQAEALVGALVNEGILGR